MLSSIHDLVSLVKEQDLLPLTAKLAPFHWYKIMSSYEGPTQYSFKDIPWSTFEELHRKIQQVILVNRSLQKVDNDDSYTAVWDVKMFFL